MAEQKMELETLFKKYQAQANCLRDQLATVTERLSAISTALELLRTEGGSGQEPLFQPVETERYKTKSMTAAINDILESNPAHKAAAEEILIELQRHGFHTESKNLKRDVFTRLYRLRKKGKLISRTEKGIRKYFLPEHKDGE